LTQDWRARFGLKHIFFRNLLFILGASTPWLVTGFLLWRAGVFEKFWFWTVTYATQYGSQVSFGQGIQILAVHFPGVIGTAWPIWVLSFLGLIALSIDPTARRRAGSLTTFAL